MLSTPSPDPSTMIGPYDRQRGNHMNMRLAGVLGIASCFLEVSAGAESFGVTLAPSSEVSRFGDPRGSGFGLLAIDGTTISYTFFVRGIQEPKGGYIQVGDRFTE